MLQKKTHIIILHSKYIKSIKGKNKIHNFTSLYIAHYSVRMDSHQAHIVEYRGTVQLQILIRIQLWKLTSLFLKEYTYFLRSSSKEGMQRHTNIPLTLLYFGMPNS